MMADNAETQERLKPNRLTHTAAYHRLRNLRSVPHLSELFTGDSGAQRGDRFTLHAPSLFLDISKQRITPDIFEELCRLYQQSGADKWLSALFSGAIVNQSEQRAAWHTRLRQPYCPGDAVSEQIEQQLTRAEVIVNRIHQGVWRGFSGKRITDVVNLGVGGSDLGPLMVTHALKEYAQASAQDTRVHFASTLDGSQLFELLGKLNPETTLFLVVSKSFTTIDTLSNAGTARSWLQRVCPDGELMLRCHFIAVSARPERMSAWGIPVENQLLIWDEVGGRFSLWSCVGLAIALALGMQVFRQLLAGAHGMDQHVLHNPVSTNIPAIMALLGIWNVNIQRIHAQAILPYDGRLKYLPDFLGQLEMESNGKSVDQLGQPLNHASCPVLWGGVGANAQHAFYQLLHQGTQAIAADFIVAARRYTSEEAGCRHSSPHEQALKDQHRLNLSNCLAQSRVLALGNAGFNGSVFSEHRYPGNQPSSSLVLEHLTPYTLGSLIACYEHKVFLQAVIWGINPFDQWGVELGKQVALQLEPLLSGVKESSKFDSSTQALARQLSRWSEPDEGLPRDAERGSIGEGI